MTGITQRPGGFSYQRMTNVSPATWQVFSPAGRVAALTYSARDAERVADALGYQHPPAAERMNTEGSRPLIRLVIAHLDAVVRGEAMDERASIECALENARAALHENARGVVDGWKPSSVEPPHNPKKGSLGTEYLIYPPTSGGDRTAFYGRRLGGAACWYRYGAQVHGVDYWHELPAIPVALTGERNG